MPIPKPKTNEDKFDFISRCMGNDDMKSEYPDEKQRAAVCNAAWDERNANLAIVPEEGESYDEFLSRAASDPKMIVMYNKSKTRLEVAKDLFSQANADKVSEMGHYITFASETGAIRLETFNSKEHIVVPVVAVVEGVMFASGADGPELVTAEVLSRAPGSWNGRPVVVNHPKSTDGEMISANDPITLESQSIGVLFNTKVEDKKLKTEAWIDTARASELGGVIEETINAVSEGEVVEVSVGAFVSTLAQEGTFDDKEFSAIWQDVVPDHLAILEKGVKGACSIEDGCGTNRVASCGCQSKEAQLEKKTLNALTMTNASLMSDFEKISIAITDKLNGEGFLTDIQGDTNSGIAIFFSWDNGLLGQEFEVNSEDKVEFKGEAFKVVADVTFKPLNKEELKVDKTEIINALIANPKTRWAEGHRTVLESMEEEQLELLEPVEEETPAEASEETTEDKDEASDNEEITVEQYLAAAPESIRDAFQEGLEETANKRKRLITAIIKHKANPYDQAELEAMSTRALNKLSNFVEVEDYSGQGSVRTASNAKDEDSQFIPLKPVFETKN